MSNNENEKSRILHIHRLEELMTEAQGLAEKSMDEFVLLVKIMTIARSGWFTKIRFISDSQIPDNLMKYDPQYDTVLKGYCYLGFKTEMGSTYYIKLPSFMYYELMCGSSMVQTSENSLQETSVMDFLQKVFERLTEE